jgi:outer membrane protein TolC
MGGGRRKAPAQLLCLLLLLATGCSAAQVAALVVPEQRHLALREPEQIPSAAMPALPPPPTVSNPPPPSATRDLSLDEAIRIGLANSQVVRVLAGVAVTTSTKTIYDTAITNTTIDEARAAFDPTLLVQNNWNRTEQPAAVFNPTSPTGASIFGPRLDDYNFRLGLTKKTVLGGTFNVDFTRDHTLFHPSNVNALNPQDRSAVALGYTQPLLKGAGVQPNVAPIVIARINTERSYFEYKDSVQELVRGVAEAYWAVEFARVDVWVHRQQVEQGEYGYKLADARQRAGLGNAAAVSQARTALANFRANLVGAEAALLNREAALRNLLGLAPTDPARILPTTPPLKQRVEPNWDEVVRLAEQRRPDLIELNLILEADHQALIIANNQALPQVDATMLYRWNGLEGVTPGGPSLATGAGQFTDWTLGVNFSVPLGLRQARAVLRRTELIITRDRANLDQGIHNALNELAATVRDLAQFHEQYLAFKETREAARINLDQQLADFRAGRSIYLNVLQAISDWGSAVSSEAQALAQYNTALARLERETGTILETHGVWFSEERFKAIGPLGRLAHPRAYPAAVFPSPNANRYPVGSGPADRALEMERPTVPTGEEVPRPRVLLLPPPVE